MIISGTFQFTPLREGRRGTRRTSPGTADISIHAPPRGATGVSFSCLLWLSISIHAPPRGATAGKRAGKATDIFQFTPLREGRRIGGAARQPPADFNSRPSARGDARQMGTFTTTSAFQFTPLREGRRTRRKRASTICAHFNSRPSARGDYRLLHDEPNGEIFQFTPLREGRPDGVQHRYRA